jgi:hypothetical protein
MTELIIRLKGEVQSSNFEEWKNELIARLRSVNTELVLDEDFVRAGDQVKAFKNAESMLKEAKQSAIAQAADIQRLFGSIDVVAEETRQVRLALERQIRTRKQEIKERMIEGAINAVHAAIAVQSLAFQSLDHGRFFDRARFDAAAKGKSTSSSLARALESLVREIEQEIGEEGLRVADNIAILDGIADEYRMLFQDRGQLIQLSKSELRLTIDKRIMLFKEDTGARRASRAVSESEGGEERELNPDAPEVAQSRVAIRDRYRITLEMLASREEATELARLIRDAHGGRKTVESVRLSRVHE